MYKFKDLFLLISCSILAVLSASTEADVVNTWGENLVVVNTSSGLVQGEAGGSIGNRTWYRFRGIPYAEPPIGKLRFEAPVKRHPWNGILNATKNGSACIQGNEPVTGNEDCLSIEIYTPELPNKTNKLPVIAYTYGGGFLGGSLNFEDQSPSLLLSEGVIFVGYTYRLGAFGFLSTGDVSLPGNAGLKDQVLALQWIKENIENFGGDPNKITLFGQSAAASSIGYILQAPQTKGLYNNVVMLSGSTLNSWALSRHPMGFAQSVATELEIPTTNVSRMLEDLKSVSAEKLQQAVQSQYSITLLSNPTGGLPLGPVQEENQSGAVVTGYSRKKLIEGNFNTVPIFIGDTSLEARTLDGVSSTLRLLFAIYNQAPSNLVPVGMNVKKLMKRITLGDKIKFQYFGINPIGISEIQSLTWLSEDQFVRPIHEAVRLYSKKNPVYYYSFDHEGSLYGVKERTFTGVGHNEDLGYIFDFGKTGSEQDKVIRSRLVRLITNFAKYGNPTPKPESLLQNIQWPVNSGNETLLQLSIKTNLEVIANPNQVNMEFWQKAFEDFGKHPISTY